jgi:hypothetical protein
MTMSDRHLHAEEESKAWDCAQSAAEAGAPNLLLEWAVSRWRDEVQHRPLINKNRRPLDDCWRQVIRYAGGDPVELCGPAHDELLALGGRNADAAIQDGAEAKGTGS